jgi:hypothetical protein
MAMDIDWKSSETPRFEAIEEEPFTALVVHV